MGLKLMLVYSPFIHVYHKGGHSMKQYMYYVNYLSPVNHKFDRADNPKTVLLSLYLNVFWAMHIIT